MRRALIAFQDAGLDPVAAPIRAPNPAPFEIDQLIPRTSSWYGSYLAIHEWVGLAYYAMRS